MSMLRSDTAFPRAPPLHGSEGQAIGPVSLGGSSALHALQSQGDLSPLQYRRSSPEPLRGVSTSKGCQTCRKMETCHSSQSSQMLRGRGSDVNARSVLWTTMLVSVFITS